MNNNTSLVTACKNREENLLKVLDSWLQTDCEELIFVDWSCDVPLFETFHEAGINDQRIKILRVEDEPRWILTHAYNVGLKRSDSSCILKLDNEHMISRDFLAVNSLAENLDARIGSWRLAKDTSQTYINGAFLARSTALRDVGYFNELITTYGWDDSYLHQSLFSNGAAIAYLDPDTIQHIHQHETSRTEHQAVAREQQLAASVDKGVTEFLDRRNMYLTAVLPRQVANADHSQYETIKTSTEHGFSVAFLRRLSNPTHQLDQTHLKLANLLAYRDMYAWKHKLQPLTINLAEVHELHEALEPLDQADPTSGQAQAAAAATANGRAEQASMQMSAKRPERRNGIPKQLADELWKLLPAACSCFGHTNNEFRYQIDMSQLGLEKHVLTTLHDLLPDWVAEKVSFSLNPEPTDALTKAVPPWESVEFLIESTVFESRENMHFWAAMNSLKPYLKRSLYELIEKGGAPINVILNTSIQTYVRGDINKEELVRRLKPLDLIFPSRNQGAFRAWTRRRANAIKQYAGEEVADLVQQTLMDNPRTEQANLTLATSMFKGSQHMIDYALNIRKMHLFERTDVVISIVPSPEANDQEKCLKYYFSDAANVSVIPMASDPGLYECWNSTIRNARSPYVSNANIDDRRGLYHSDYLIYLMEYQGLDGAASALMADNRDTHDSYSVGQDTWFCGMGRNITKDDLLTRCETSAKSQNMMHCMPIWKAALHEDIGYFDEEQFGTSADWEFWLRATAANKKLRLADIPLGFYLINTESHNRRDPGTRQLMEHRILAKYFSADLGSTDISLN